MDPPTKAFDIEIKDRKGCENYIANHLSRLLYNTYIGEQRQIKEEFLDEQLLALEIEELSWYTDIENYLVSEVFLPNATSQQKKRLAHEARSYI